MMGKSTVIIEKMAFGGAGFGRCGGKACFIPFAAPGDEVRFRVVREKASYVEGEIVDLIRPAPQRIEPLCPVFGQCGGCDWQYLPYADQLFEKQRIFTDFLCRSGRLPTDRVLPIVAAEASYGYRSRLQLKLRKIDNRFHIGFYRAGSHFVIDIPEGCPLADPVANGIIAELHHILPKLPEGDGVPQIDISTGEDGSAVVTFHYTGNRVGDVAGYLRGISFSSLSSPVGVFLRSGRKSNLTRVSGIDTLSYSVPGLSPGAPDVRLSFSRGGFSQVNYRQNLQLIGTIHRWLRLTGSERVLDLFCGNGNLSLPLAPYVAGIVGLEAYEGSIDDANNNRIANGAGNVRFICADAATELKRLATAGEKFDIVLLDPPRAGARSVVEYLPALQPRSIVYVSCDPATLARDIDALRNSGYEIVRSCPVDMFPQTYHIESVTLLQPARESVEVE